VVASTLEEGKEKSISTKQAVNASSYRSFHSSQMFEDGFSFSGFERNKVWLNLDGKYVDVSDVSGADDPNDSRAAVMADFDDDGDVDLFVHGIQRERHRLYRNDAREPGTFGFLKLVPVATRSQHEAIGATVIVHGPQGPVARPVARGDGFVTCSDRELVFGLGDSKEALVEVVWPGGQRESFGTLAAGTRARLVEGTGAAEPYAARPRPLPDPLPPGLTLDEGDRVPTLLVADAGGAPVALDLVALGGGKPVLVNFWASYCAPCVAELPLLGERHESGDQVVVTLSLDVKEDVAAARDLLRAAGVDFPAYYLAGAPVKDDGGRMPLADLIDLERLTLPTTLVVSPEGRVDAILRGPLTEER